MIVCLSLANSMEFSIFLKRFRISFWFRVAQVNGGLHCRDRDIFCEHQKQTRNNNIRRSKNNQRRWVQESLASRGYEPQQQEAVNEEVATEMCFSKFLYRREALLKELFQTSSTLALFLFNLRKEFYFLFLRSLLLVVLHFKSI